MAPKQPSSPGPKDLTDLIMRNAKKNFRGIMQELRNVRSAGTGRGGFTIWGGLILAMLPSNPLGVPLKPIFDSFLSGMDYYDLLNFIEAFPALLLHIHRWGLGPGGAWRNMPVFRTPQEVIDWHRSVAPPGTNLPPPGEPLPFGVVTDNHTSRRWPYVDWITRERNDFLVRLHEAGFWDPLGYGPDGHSFLSNALAFNRGFLLSYINYIGQGNLAFLLRPSRILEITGMALGANHLDLAISRNDFALFTRWIRENPGLHGPTALNNRSKETLCEFVTAEEALWYLRTIGLNLAQPLTLPPNTLPAIPGAPTQIGHTPQIGSAGNGSPWHIAIRNNNLDFLDFLAAHTPHPTDIDNPYNAPFTPALYAYTLGKFDHFDRLLRWGADPGVVPYMVILSWPTNPQDRWLRTSLAGIRNPNPNPGGNVWQGTSVHWVVFALHDEMKEINRAANLTESQKRSRRETRMRQARTLINLVKQGNIRGEPDLSTRDLAIPPRTAWDYAKMWGYTQLAYLLDPA
ncbi:hypothetical protein BJX68DRAFT_264131 [Aspergillus pseudodeflectus]|uniref:Ankyrin repeat-containing domain protein n=1 Tax=Aspergillus pseudodeflectus TaxID=176178 RepID=A0ABR4KU35_9EURO